jgi:peptide deformylase
MPIEELLRVGTVRSIVRWGQSPVMHTPAQPVTDFDGALQQLIADMFATNTAADGAGLAACQIGVGLAVFVYDCTDHTGARRTGVICNPSVTVDQGPGRRLVEFGEGCLSLPGARIWVARPEWATCTGQDQYGEPVVVSGGETLGRCLQHETDHLAGMVFADRLSRRARRELLAAHDAVADRYPADWPVSPAVGCG